MHCMYSDIFYIGAKKMSPEGTTPRDSVCMNKAGALVMNSIENVFIFEREKEPD